ncbi:hypothetical protein BKA62DRAFT_709668 [Auriculariales sp. MPI-PUGE-AT-0066]|nr:hypothetical protein BKA62DRAFT_709668 [Auriculariales sp. MPI-PUGE-AT-0066]
MDILPTELYQEIFSCFAPIRALVSVHSETPPLAQDVLDAPLTLSLVCRRWHDICYKTPELWSFIQLAPTDIDVTNHLRQRLERTGDHALDIWINYTNIPTQFFAALHHIQQRCHAWRRICIFFPTEIPLDEWRIFTKSMPLVEELVLFPKNGRDGPIIESVQEGAEPALYLTDCPRLSSYRCHAALIVPVRPLTRLEHLTFSLRGLPDDDPLWQALDMVPTLRSLDVYFNKNSWPSHDATSPAADRTLRALRNLGVYGFPGNSDWIEHLQMPLLETLTVSIESCDSGGISSVFCALSKQVRHLILTTGESNTGGYYCAADVVSINNLETLEILELRDVHRGMISRNDQSFFEQINDNCAGDPLYWGAQIRQLIFRNSRLRLRDCESLTEFLRGRLAATADGVGPPLDVHFIDTKVKWSGTDELDFFPLTRPFVHESLVQSWTDSDERAWNESDSEEDDDGAEDLAGHESETEPHAEDAAQIEVLSQVEGHIDGSEPGLSQENELEDGNDAHPLDEQAISRAEVSCDEKIDPSNSPDRLSERGGLASLTLS